MSRYIRAGFSGGKGGKGGNECARVRACPPPLLRHLAAKHLQHQRGELHAVLGLEGERAVLLGVLLVQAAQVSQLLDHLGVEEASAWVVDTDVGLQRL